VHDRIVDREPELRALPESGDAWDDPSEDLLFELLVDIEYGRAGSFLIVERLADASGNAFGQVRRLPNGSYTVEYRDETGLWATSADDMRAAHALLTGWAFDRAGWKDHATWKPVYF
jgi:hypothetical protein